MNALPEIVGVEVRRHVLADNMRPTTSNLGQTRQEVYEARLIRNAKGRLADEYDAAQERGDVAGSNIPSVSDLGLRRDQIHEARLIGDAWTPARTIQAGNPPYRIQPAKEPK